MHWQVRILGKKLIVLIFSACFLGHIPECFGREVVLLRGGSAVAEEQVVRSLADFYGLELKTLDVDRPEAVYRALSQMQGQSILALLSSPEALTKLNQVQVGTALKRSRGASVPILIFGIRGDDDTSILRSWSRDAVRACHPVGGDFHPEGIEVARSASLNRTLAGLELPAVVSPGCSLETDQATAESLLNARGSDGSKTPVMVRVQSTSQEIFFVPALRALDRSRPGDPIALSEAFSSMAPFILFLSHAAGDYAWHSDGHYANLTIDDAWLTEPYGHLDYVALLAQMERHNFHTTIAFIPWNFDRSEEDVTALVRAHPDRFSICIHGNDHEHREFGDYKLNSLEGQVEDIKQGVARMEQFRALTGIPYDRFMVFPQGVAPEPTFAALRKYDFLGTANYQNVPLGAPFPADPVFLLRPFTAQYGNLLSYSRYTAGGGVPRVALAIQSFLGGPILAYGHESLFDEGITSFNADADYINQLQPDTQWVSLGNIARHSHLLRRRDDGGFDVRMLSREMDLKNPGDHEVVYYVQGTTVASADFSVTVDGAEAAVQRSGDSWTLRLVIPAGVVRKVRVTYANELDFARIDTGKRTLHSYVLRKVSDFRDLYLSRSSLGQAITKSYYQGGWGSMEQYAERNWWVGLVAGGIVVGVIAYRRRRARRRRAPAAFAG